MINLPAVTAATAIVCAVIGVPVGMFLNVVIERVPENAPLRPALPRAGRGHLPLGAAASIDAVRLLFARHPAGYVTHRV